MIDTKYPEITVKLVGKDGNDFNLLSCCLQVMRIAGLDKQERDSFVNEVTSAQSYTEALHIMMSWVNVK